MRMVALRNLPSIGLERKNRKFVLAGEQFDAEQKVADFFVKHGFARAVDGDEPAPQKRKYTRRSMKADEYNRTDLTAE